MSGSTWLAGIAITVLGGTSLWLAQSNAKLAERLDALEGGGALHAEASADGEGRTPGLRGEDGFDPREVERRLEALTMRVAETEKAAKARPAGTASAEGGALANLPFEAMADAPAFQKAVREVAMELAGDVRFRAKLGVGGGSNLPKKPAFHQLASVLELDANQEEKLRGELTEMQQTFLALVSEERDDGVVLLERFAEAEELADGDPRKAKIFIEVLQLKIPDSEETYLDRLMQLQGTMRKNAREFLRPQQREIWANLDLDWMGIQMDG